MATSQLIRVVTYGQVCGARAGSVVSMRELEDQPDDRPLSDDWDVFVGRPEEVLAYAKGLAADDTADGGYRWRRALSLAEAWQSETAEFDKDPTELLA